jgi:hypothetical protein
MSALAVRQSVLNRVFKHTRDQITTAVANRYSGPKSIGNIARDVTRLMSIINTEEKHIDLLPAATTVSLSSPIVVFVGGVAQGNTGTTRNGDSIKVNRIDLSLSFVFSTGTTASSTISNQQYRWWLVRWLKTPSTSGSSPFSLSDFLNVDANSYFSPLSFPNTDLNEDFQILDSGDVSLTLPIIGASSSTVQRTILHSKMCGFHQTYNGSLASNIVDNSVFFVCVASSGVNTGGSSTVTIGNRSLFIDN